MAFPMTLAYSEDQLVEQPAIQLFAELGWQTISGIEEVCGIGGTLGRETKGETVLVPGRKGDGKMTKLTAHGIERQISTRARPAI